MSSPRNTGQSHSRYKPKVKRVGALKFAIPDDSELYKNLNITPICLIDRPTLKDDEKVNIELTNFKAIAAYNWVDRSQPHILVPGFPRLWNDQPLPFQLPRDKGQVFVDQNSHHLPKSPLLPLIVAVNHYDPEFHMGEMDFITDRNGLRKLYRWVSQSSWTKDPLVGTFRIDVGLIGKTILLQRWEVCSTQSNGGPGYGVNFRRYMTAQAGKIPNVTGYHRIITFKFGDKRILMRSTTDACLRLGENLNSSDNNCLIEQNRHQVDELASELTILNIKETAHTTRKIPAEGGFLTVETIGKLYAQKSVIEIKTKSSRFSQTDYGDLYVQLLFADISNVYTGRHEMGTFHTVEKETSVSSIKEEKTGEAVQRSLKLLKKALDEIQRVVFHNLKNNGSLSLVLRAGDNKTVEVLRREEQDGFLPENVLAFIH